MFALLSVVLNGYNPSTKSGAILGIIIAATTVVAILVFPADFIIASLYAAILAPLALLIFHSFSTFNNCIDKIFKAA